MLLPLEIWWDIPLWCRASSLEYLLVLWKRSQPSKYVETCYVSAIKVHDACEHRDAVRLLSLLRLPSWVPTDGWETPLCSSFRSLLRMGLSDADDYKHQCFLVSLVQRSLTAPCLHPEGTARLSSWSSKGFDCLQLGDLGSSWSVRKTCVREMWEVSWESHKTLDSRAVFKARSLPLVLV